MLDSMHTVYATILIFESPCADPESLSVGSNSALTTFHSFFSKKEGKVIQIPLKTGHHCPTSEKPYTWPFAGRPMMAKTILNASLVAL